MTSHLEANLQRDIERIQGKIRRMADLALAALQHSLDTFLLNRRASAYLVILRDHHLDELEKEIDRLCLEFLVRHQPVAGHLRFIYATIKVNQELERVGDYCESIARQSLKINHLDLCFLHDRYRRMANLVLPMLKGAVEAFLARSPELARHTMVDEPAVDNLRTEIYAEMVRHEREGRIPVEALNPLLTIARRFERVSDQAENICEEVVYMCTGEYAKHKGVDLVRVLFVDPDNSCLSQLAEAIGGSMNQPKVLFNSAGVDPSAVDSRTISFLREKAILASEPATRSLAQVPYLEYYQVVVAFGTETLERIKLPAKAIEFVWDIQDPSVVRGTPADVRAAYEAAFQYLESHIRDLVEAIVGTDAEPAGMKTFGE